jgi:hypothetical protein
MRGWGFHSGFVEDLGHLGCDTVHLWTFRDEHQETRTHWHSVVFLKTWFSTISWFGNTCNRIVQWCSELSMCSCSHFLYWNWFVVLLHVIRVTSSLYLVATHRAFGSWSMTCCRGIRYSDLRRQRYLIFGYQSCWTHWRKKEDTGCWTIMDPCPI